MLYDMPTMYRLYAFSCSYSLLISWHWQWQRIKRRN